MLIVAATGILAIAGVAIAGAIGSGGGSSTVHPVAAATSTPSLSPSVTPSPSPTAAPAVHTSSPSPSPLHTAKQTPKPTATHVVALPTASTSSCPPAAQRVASARGLLQHPQSLPNVTVVTAGPRAGLLGNADAANRTVTLYVRSCAEEPTIRIAVVWAYEAGQFIPTETWDSSTRAHWEQMRGISGSASATQLKQDAAAVYAFWQTGTSSPWQSPYPPPPASQLSQLASYLHPS